jgi:hypothetical protein
MDTSVPDPWGPHMVPPGHNDGRPTNKLLIIHIRYYSPRVLPEAAQPTNGYVTPFEVGNHPTTDGRVLTSIPSNENTTSDAECNTEFLRRDVEQKPAYVTTLNATVGNEKVRTLSDGPRQRAAGQRIHKRSHRRAHDHSRLMSHEDAYPLMRPNYIRRK